ncbi:hypothetical protein PS634_00535 [Pseudomonas fluorescens]|nr:hypothetical protein PS634_00535 [Pseudomonas fluorescens]
MFDAPVFTWKCDAQRHGLHTHAPRSSLYTGPQDAQNGGLNESD